MGGPMASFDQLRPGQRLSAADTNRLTDAVTQMGLSAGGDDISVVPTAGGLSVTNSRPRDVTIRITGAPTGTAHPWQQVDETDPTAFPDYDAPGFGMTGDVALFPAYDVNGSTADLTGTKVRAWLAPTGDAVLFDAGDECCGWGADTTSLYSGNGGAIDTNGILPYPITPVSGLGLLGQETFDFFDNPLPSDASVVKTTLIEIPPHTTVRIYGRVELMMLNIASAVVVSGTYGWLDPAYGSFTITAGIVQVDGSFNIIGGLASGAMVVRGQWLNLQGLLVPIYDGLGVSGYTDSPSPAEWYQTGDYLPNSPYAGGGILDDDGNIIVPGVWQGNTKLGPRYFANDTDDPVYFCIAIEPANLNNVTGYIVLAIGIGDGFSVPISGLTSLHWDKLCCATTAPPTTDGSSPPIPTPPPSPPVPPSPSRPRVVAKTANYSIEDFVDGVKGDASGGAFTVTMPDAAAVFNGRKVSVKKTDSSGNAVSVAAMTGAALDTARVTSGSADQTIDGSTTPIAITTQWLSLTFESDGTNWIII